MKNFLEHLLREFETPLDNPVLVFSLILFIILLAPILLKRLNIPGIIGLIISGIIIGPFGLGILEKSSAVELFSTIGLLYIMFIAGLELDMNEFKVNRNRSLLFGLFTFAFPILIGFPVCYFLLKYDMNSSILTASMFATHTLVSYPIVSKLGVSKNQAVAITVGGTILTDTAVLIILAVIMGKHNGELNAEFWVRLSVSLAIFSVIMFFFIPRLAKWFFRKLESEKHAHYIFVLSVVFFAAFLAEVAGVEPIIGAFVAGLALNRLIPHSSALMNRIEFMGNSLFIPFFLIAVGMVVDLGVIFSGIGAWIVAGTLTLAALIGKWFAAFATQKAFGFSSAQRQLIFGLSSSHAAATLAIILVGYNAGILDENILNGTIILILVTCVVASFATEKASRKLVLTGEAGAVPSTLPKEYTNEHILVPIANETSIQKQLELAFLIKDHKSVNPISVLSVVPNNEEAEMNIIRSKSKLEKYVLEASASEINVKVIATIDHNVSSGIARTSREIMADLVILGWPSKTGILDKLIGERLESILHSVSRSIFITDMEVPLVTNKRLVLVTPPFAEREHGFVFWLRKITKLAQELSIPIVHFGNEESYSGILKAMSDEKLNADIVHVAFDDWEDILVLSREIKSDDIIVLTSARRGSISHMNILDNLPWKLEKYFDHYNKIIIYPEEYQNEYHGETYEDLNSGPINKGIETIGKGLESILKSAR